jgi:ADP-heptose:LPS heptosyltransferase
MGDVLMNLPAIRLLRQSFPKAWIALLVDDSTADLLKGHPDVDEVMSIDARKLKTSFRGRHQLIRDIRLARFQLAVVSNPDKFLHLLVFLAGIPRRVGWRRKWGFLLSKGLEDRKNANLKHEIESNLDLARLVSTAKEWDGALGLPVDEHARNKLRERLANDLSGYRGIIALHTGSSNPAKRWSRENFSELCRLIRSRSSYRPILIGDAREKDLADQIVRLADGWPLNWAGALTLKELVALLNDRNVKTLVSADSGPVHVAWMSGTAVVALYAQNVPGSNPARWGPLSGKSRVLHKPMNEISPAEVFSAIESVVE